MCEARPPNRRVNESESDVRLALWYFWPNNKLNKGHGIMTLLIWLIFIAAAVLEVGGDALIRKGLRGSSAAFIAGGCLMLSCYGVAVNIVKWDFSKILEGS